MFRLMHERPEHIIDHSAQVLDFYEREAADAAILFPSETCELVPRSLYRFIPDHFWKDHLAPLVNAQHCFHFTPGYWAAPTVRITGSTHRVIHLLL